MPFWWYEGETRRSVEEVRDTLARSVTKVRWFRPPEESYPFAGRVDENRFSIARVVRGQDSFNPMLYGRLTALPDGTKVTVLFTFHPIVWAGLFLFSAFAARLTLQGVGGPAVAVAFLWTGAIVFFSLGAPKSRRLLDQCLELREPTHRGG